MDHSNQLELIRIFADAFAHALSEGLTLRQGSPWEIKSLAEPDPSKALQQEVNFRLSAEGGLQGACFVAFEQVQVTAIDSRLPAEPASSTGEEQGDALEEVLVTAMEGLRAALSTQYGSVTFHVERVDNLPPEGLVTTALATSVGGEDGSSILLRFDETLLASLTSPNERKHPAKEKKVAIEPGNLQLVMDVELNVSLRFGQCQLPLRDVLDLNSGSVIELDRDVDDPVELLLDGKVIARGEAVIVDGNYGLRITEIPQPIASHFSSQSFKG